MNDDFLFISVLGTNDYLPCRYHPPGAPRQATEPLRFVQEAVLCLMPPEQRPGRVLVLVTQEARRKNWEDNGHQDWEGKVLERQGLARRLESLELNCQAVSIPDGRNEDEIWEIFRIITSLIPEQARLCVDITHSFRSLSMVLLAALRYAKAAAGAEVQAVHYGAMEALGDVGTVRDMPEEKRLVPIFDLTPFDAILDWAEAATDFIRSGNPAGLGRLSLDRVTPILAATRGQDQQARAIRNFVDSLERFCSHVSANRGPDIPGLAHQARQNLNQARRCNLLPALLPLFDRIEAELAGFTGDSLDMALGTARWCLEHNFLPQGYTALQEGIITWCLEQAGWPDTCAKEARQAVSSAFAIHSQKIPAQEWNANARSHEDIIQSVLGLPGLERLARHMDRLGQMRNNINHGGFNQDRPDPGRLRHNLDGLIQEITAWKEGR